MLAGWLSVVGPCLEGRGDLVSRFIVDIIRVTVWVIGVINLLTKSPRPFQWVVGGT